MNCEQLRLLSNKNWNWNVNWTWCDSYPWMTNTSFRSIFFNISVPSFWVTKNFDFFGSSVFFWFLRFFWSHWWFCFQFNRIGKCFSTTPIVFHWMLCQLAEEQKFLEWTLEVLSFFVENFLFFCFAFFWKITHFFAVLLSTTVQLVKMRFEMALRVWWVSVVGVAKLSASQNQGRVGESSFCLFFFVTLFTIFSVFLLSVLYWWIHSPSSPQPLHHHITVCRSWSAAKPCQLQLMNLIWFVLHTIITNVSGSFFVVVSDWCYCTVHQGQGKTSLAKALAQKLSIRLQQCYPLAQLVEINAHSLFSKWFSESAKLVRMKIVILLRAAYFFQNVMTQQRTGSSNVQENYWPSGRHWLLCLCSDLWVVRTKFCLFLTLLFVAESQMKRRVWKRHTQLKWMEMNLLVQSGFQMSANKTDLSWIGSACNDVAGF